jgi:hypothetical protein
MPRADRLTLNAGLDMPPVDHVSNKSSHNVLLDRAVSGIPAGLPADRSLIGLFTNFARLTDKALREYDAARAELVLYVASHGGLRTDLHLRAVDHMENCVGAAHRAVLNARALWENRVGRNGPRLTELQEQRLGGVRHAVEHSDEKIRGIQKNKKWPPFAAGEPYSLRLANRSMVIGANVLTYKELVSAMTKMYRTIEAIRGVSTGTPGPDWPNAKLRTDPGMTTTRPSSMRPSDYFRELSRLTVTH